MPNFADNHRTTFSIIAKITVTVIVVSLLFVDTGMMTADEGESRPTRPVRPTANQEQDGNQERNNEEEEFQKPTLFSGNGKFLASLRFWERNKKDSQPATTSRQSKTPPRSQNAATKVAPKNQSIPTTSGASTATSSAPEPPPNPYLELEAAPPSDAPLPRPTETLPPQADDTSTFVPQISQPPSDSYLSYSFDTRDWIDTFSPQYEENRGIAQPLAANQNVVPNTVNLSAVVPNAVASNAVIPNTAVPNTVDHGAAEHRGAVQGVLPEVSSVSPKVAHRSPAVFLPPDKNNVWDGHATTLTPASPSASAPSAGAAISSAVPAKKPDIDLTPSYKKRLPHIQTCGVVVVQADFPLTEIASILEEINLLQHDLTRYIGVPEPNEKIELCLFKSESSYTSFLEAVFPRAPLDRRALYVKLDHKPGTLMVQKTKNFEIDLRHEMTHAIIHASIPTVPIWLDEGLAKYFEVPAQDRLSNNPYMSQIRWNIRLGVVPSLDRLVQLETIDDMGSKEYRDSWAWAHFLIHRSPETHRLLAAYLQMLVKWSPPEEKKPESASKLASAGQKVKTLITQDLLGRNTEASIPSLKLYLDEIVPNQRTMFKEHFGEADK